jgi:hypothetical protein
MGAQDWSRIAYVDSYMWAHDADVAANNMGPTLVSWMLSSGSRRFLQVGPDGSYKLDQRVMTSGTYFLTGGARRL